MISISACIMYAGFSEERRTNVERIINALDTKKIIKHWKDFQMFGDYYRNGAWWNAKRCWRFGLEANATHHLILQDDVEVCVDFVTGLFDVISVFPHRIINLFFGRRSQFDGSERWGRAEGIWGQAVVMPTPVIFEFLAWEKENISPEFKHDDARVTMFCVDTSRIVMIPFPNLVDHRSDLKSVLGHSLVKPADQFLGDISPHSIEWSDTENTMFAVRKYSKWDHYLIRNKE